MSTVLHSDAHSDMFRPPINRLMKVLDPSFFHKSIPISAAQVKDPTQISRFQKELKNDILQLERIAAVRYISKNEGAKALLLKPEIKASDVSTWSRSLQELADTQQVAVTPYTLDLDYDYWSYYDIMSAILPEDEYEEIPSGFSTVGHVAHLNLRDNYLPFKTLIATVLLDKSPGIRTVINKTDIVGSQRNEYRTFNYELLAGDPDMNVEAKGAGNCVFRFDFSKVYWNPRLNTEHRRLIDLFQPGEAVCDVMAGIGPFAVPAGKKRVFVWANDLNPESYSSLQTAITRNKVSNFVRASNEDGRTFIRTATHQLLQPPPSQSPLQTPGPSRSTRSHPPQPPPPPPPRTFSHYIMNLPASALTFLPSFIGLYAGHESLFRPTTTTPLPLIHAYCFSSKSADDAAERLKICELISGHLGATVAPEDEDVSIVDVRNVAPSKRMFCASFRLPAEVAFRRREEV